eukprot:6191062-Pleurochrysis_carterae.AAC.2
MKCLDRARAHPQALAGRQPDRPSRVRDQRQQRPVTCDEMPGPRGMCTKGFVRGRGLKFASTATCAWPWVELKKSEQRKRTDSRYLMRTQARARYILDKRFIDTFLTREG